MLDHLKNGTKTCSIRKIEKIVKIFLKYSTQIPQNAGAFADENGTKSYGFYIKLLELEKFDTEPKPFFDLLEIDQKIGWTNSDHVEMLIFYLKAVKIIKDEKVSFFLFSQFEKKAYFVRQNLGQKSKKNFLQNFVFQNLGQKSKKNVIHNFGKKLKMFWKLWLIKFR